MDSRKGSRFHTQSNPTWHVCGYHTAHILYYCEIVGSYHIRTYIHIYTVCVVVRVKHSPYILVQYIAQVIVH